MTDQNKRSKRTGESKMSKSEVKAPTAAQIVAASLAQIVNPLAVRLSVLESDHDKLTLTGDFIANAWKVTLTSGGENYVLRVQPVRLNRLNIVNEDGSPMAENELAAIDFTGYLGLIAVPFSELATRNATISLYELDWLLSQYVTRAEASFVNAALESVESAGD
jgi:hypothetical protein